MEQRILVIEDDPDIGRLLSMHMSACVPQVRWESNGTRGLLLAQARSWDVIVLDWLLPGIDGVTICRRLRDQGRTLPILMLTARSNECDRVHGLDAGADDYVAKPFGIEELKARVRAQLRNAVLLRSAQRAETDAVAVRVGALCIDERGRTATLRDRPVILTGREFDLLLHFARHPGRVFTRAQLLAAVWGAGFEGYEHTVNSHINRLRAKLHAGSLDTGPIVTVWGTGYRFDAATLQ